MKKIPLLVKCLITSAIIGLFCFMTFKGHADNQLPRAKTIGRIGDNQRVNGGLQVDSTTYINGPVRVNPTRLVGIGTNHISVDDSGHIGIDTSHSSGCTCYSGLYKPVIYDSVSTLSVSFVDSAFYSRVGNKVDVSGFFNASADVRNDSIGIYISIPINSTFTGEGSVQGILYRNGILTSSPVQSSNIMADLRFTDRVRVWYSTGGGSGGYSFNFSYYIR